MGETREEKLAEAAMWTANRVTQTLVDYNKQRNGSPADAPALAISGSVAWRIDGVLHTVTITGSQKDRCR